MTITEVSKQFHVTPEALRYYERIGLLPKIGKDGGGRRNYTEHDLGWVYYVTALRRAGVSIESMQEYIRLFYEGDSTREVRKEILVRERARLAEHIEEMKQTLAYLDTKIANYEGHVRDFEVHRLER